MNHRTQDLNPPTVLIAEDSADDALLLKMAIEKIQPKHLAQIVHDGNEAISYLDGEGKYANRSLYPIPSLIILDLKMPKKNGFEVLQWLADHPVYSTLPVLIWSSSRQGIDVQKAYKLGANTYFEKPVDFDRLQDTIQQIFLYWDLALRPKQSAA